LNDRERRTAARPRGGLADGDKVGPPPVRSPTPEGESSTTTIALDARADDRRQRGGLQVRTTTRIATALCVPLVLLTAGPAAIAWASHAPLTGTSASDGRSAAVPADFVTLADDTGTLTVGVPASWTELRTGLDVDTGSPSIKATPDARAFLSGFDGSGMTVKALPFTPDTDALAHRWGWDGFCDLAVVQPYNEGALTGTEIVYTGCLDADPQAEAHVIAVNAASKPFTALLHVQIAGADQRPVLDGILATLQLTSDTVAGSIMLGGRADPPVSSVAASPSSTSKGAIGAPFPSPSGDVPADWSPLVDLTGTITISVPSTWTDLTLAEFDPPRPVIQAASDQYQYSVFAAPGVVYRAYPRERPALERLKTSIWLDDCTHGPVQTYDDGLFVGYIEVFDNCAGTSHRIVQLEAHPRTGDFLAEVVVHLTGGSDDAAILDGLLSSFNIAGESTAPTSERS
jgi:hypothetical protein